MKSQEVGKKLADHKAARDLCFASGDQTPRVISFAEMMLAIMQSQAEFHSVSVPDEEVAEAINQVIAITEDGAVPEGWKEVRRGTKLFVQKKNQKISKQGLAEKVRDGLARSKVAFLLEQRRNQTPPRNVADLLRMLRREADDVYGEFGLPTGSQGYRLPIGAMENDWAAWRPNDEQPDIECRRHCMASLLPRYGDFDNDHPVIHAAKLHDAIEVLSAVSTHEPLDPFQLVCRAMAAQLAYDILTSVTAKRRKSGLTDAEAVWRGDDNRRDTSRGGRGASKAKVAEGETNRSRVLAAAGAIRDRNPIMKDVDLVKAVVEAMTFFPVKQHLAEITVSKHIRELKKLGHLAAKVKPTSS